MGVSNGGRLRRLAGGANGAPRFNAHSRFDTFTLPASGAGVEPLAMQFHVSRDLAFIALMLFVGGLFFAAECWEERRRYRREELNMGDENWMAQRLNHDRQVNDHLRHSMWCFGSAAALLLGSCLVERIMELISS